MEHHSAVLQRRLNPNCARGQQDAASLCHTRTHAGILPEHRSLKLLEQGDGASARNVDSLLNQQILPFLSQHLMSHMAAKQKPSSLQLTWDDEQGIVLVFDEQAEGEVL